MKLRSSVVFAAALLAVLILSASARAGEVNSTWSDGGDGWSWSDPANWNPVLAVPPINVGSTVFNATIPASMGAAVWDETCGVGSIRSLDVGTGSEVSVRNTTTPGSADVKMNVTYGATLSGLLRADGGRLIVQPTDPNQVILGNQLRLYAQAGGLLSVDAPGTFDTSGYTGSWTVMNVEDAGSSLDVNHLTTIDDSFSGGYGRQYHYFKALNGGHLGLPNVETIHGPASDESTKFAIEGGSTVDLGSLRQVDTSYAHGLVEFSVTGSSLELPSFESGDNALFRAYEGGSVSMNGAQPASLDFSRAGYDAYCLIVDGTGSRLDLDAVTTIDDSFVGGYGRQYHYYRALDGGHLGLPNVETILGPASNETTRFEFGSGSSVDLGNLRQIESAHVEGHVDFLITDSVLDLPSLETAKDASFQVYDGATADLPSLTVADKTSFGAYDGGVITVNGSLPATMTFSRASWDGTCLVADGSGSRLDLDAVTTINDSFSGGYGRQYHYFKATGGGHLGLPNVETIHGPASDESTRFSIEDGSTIDLSSLRQVDTMSSYGVVEFLARGSHVALPSFESGDNALFWAYEGGSISMTGSEPALLNFSRANWNVHCLDVTGQDSRLDLDAVTVIDDSYSAGYGRQYHYFRSLEGGHLGLPNVEIIHGPASDESTRFEVDPNSTIDLGSLRQVGTSHGAGVVEFVIKGTQLALPVFEDGDNALFWAYEGGSITMTGSEPASLDFSRANWNVHCLDVTGQDSRLDLDAVTALDDSYSAGYGRQYHYYRALDGGHMGLPNVTSLQGPASDETTQFTSSNGGSIDLSSLETVTNHHGSAELQLIADTNSRIDAGSLRKVTQGYLTVRSKNNSHVSLGQLSCDARLSAIVSGGSSLEVGALRTSHNGALEFSDPNTVLRSAGTVALGDQLRMIGTGPAAASFGGDFGYRHTDTADCELGQAEVTFDGSGNPPQIVEVGGIDLATDTILIADSNFGFDRMVVGDQSSAATVILADNQDNGHRTGYVANEALYLWGVTDPNQETLRILGGSTLVLAGVNVYVNDGGSWVHLNSLAAKGETFAYGDGFVELRDALIPGDANLDDVVDVGDLGLLAVNWHTEIVADWARGDFTADGYVDVGDLGLLASNWKAGAEVPEPASVVLIALAGLACLRRKR